MSDGVVIALIGVFGAIIGSVATVATQLMAHCLHARSEEKKEGPRKALLKTMLNDPRWTWRELKTLRHVIGADEEATKKLLLDLGARASEDGQPLWGLIKRNPLPNETQ